MYRNVTCRTYVRYGSKRTDQRYITVSYVSYVTLREGGKQA